MVHHDYGSNYLYCIKPKIIFGIQYCATSRALLSPQFNAETLNICLQLVSYNCMNFTYNVLHENIQIIYLIFYLKFGNTVQFSCTTPGCYKSSFNAAAQRASVLERANLITIKKGNEINVKGENQFEMNKSWRFTFTYFIAVKCTPTNNTRDKWIIQ